MCPTDRSGCSAARHATRSAYVHHGCRCPDACDAMRRYAQQRKLTCTPSGYVSPIPSARKVQALMTLGWPAYEITQRLGWSHANSNLQRLPRRSRMYRHHADAIDRVYRELSGSTGPSATTRRRAVAAGYLAPLAWDDIDHDDAPPTTSGNNPVEVDEVAVDRAVKGTLPAAKLRREERLAAVVQLTTAGVAGNEIARRLDYDRKQVERDRSTIKTQRYRTRQNPGVAS